MQLISTSKESTRELSFAKARVEDEEQDKTGSEGVVETTESGPYNSETSGGICL